mmetsp:Transcript_49608/g.131781  ORF Transcript_49608/g.131781 Transcript_49608/m.131781 type:complete len:500 (+) Transcript_49608:105-1604(+)
MARLKMRLPLLLCTPSLPLGTRLTLSDDTVASITANATAALDGGERPHALCRIGKEGVGFEVSAVAKLRAHQKRCAPTCSRINGFDLREKLMPSFFSTAVRDSFCLCYLKGSPTALFRYPRGASKCGKKECWARYEGTFNRRTGIKDIFSPGSLSFSCEVCEISQDCEPSVEIPGFPPDASDGDGVEFAPRPLQDETEDDVAEPEIIEVPVVDESFPPPSLGGATEPCPSWQGAGGERGQIVLPLQCRVSPGTGGFEWQDQLKEGGCRGNLLALAFSDDLGDPGSSVIQAGGSRETQAKGAHIGLRVPQTHDLSGIEGRPLPAGLAIKVDENNPQFVSVWHKWRRSVRVEVITNGRRVILPKVHFLTIHRSFRGGDSMHVTLGYTRPPSLINIVGSTLRSLGLVPGTWLQEMIYHPRYYIDVVAFPESAATPCRDESVDDADAEDPDSSDDGRGARWWEWSSDDAYKGTGIFEDMKSMLSDLGDWLFNTGGSDVEFVSW